MNQLMDRFLELTDSLSKKSKKYISYYTLRNFIIHLSEINDEKEKQKAVSSITTCLYTIEIHNNEFDRIDGYNLYVNYLKPLVDIYRKVGFVENHRLIYHLIVSTNIDIVFGLILFGFPYPILTSIALFSHYVVFHKSRKSARVFSMYY